MVTKNAQNKIGEYQLNSNFNGYVARLDKTIVGPNLLVSPSKNVMIGTSGRIASVSGYTLDGAGSTIIDSGILSKFDFFNFKGDVRNMRAGFMTVLNDDGKLQFRYDNGTTVSWLDLFGKTISRSVFVPMTSINLSFTTFFDTTEKLKLCLWVDGTGNVYEWNGALTTIAKASGNTLTMQGVMTAKTTISFNSTTLTISDSANGFLEAGFVSGDKITVSGAVNSANNKTFQIETVAAGVITLKSGSVLSSEVAGASITIKKQGKNNWISEGFYSSRDKKIIINNIEYTYTGGESTDTLTGITPALPSITIGTPVYQSPVITAISSMTYIESTFTPTVIGCGKDNQVYLGSSVSNNQYISKVNNYKDYTFSSTRLSGEGMLLRLKAPPIKYISQESQESSQAYDMYISSGQNNWQVVRSTLSSDNTKEKLELIDMKIAPLQGAKSEKLATKMKNHIVFIGCDNVANFLGYMSNQFVPIMTDFSSPIIDDMKGYDFTDASIEYHRNYIFIAIPKHGIIRIYNMTNQTQSSSNQSQVEDINNQPWFWEAPIGYPISSFYVVNGELYGHGYNTSESYKLFSGTSFNGQDIDTNATFGYDDKGERTQSKGSNEIWIEGYIKQNTKLKIEVSGDLDYFRQSKTTILDGSDSRLVSFGGKSGAIGKDSLGTKPLGGTTLSTETLPAWFHGAKTYQQVPFYLEQVSFSSKGVDIQWELLCYGTNARMTTEGNNSITE